MAEDTKKIIVESSEDASSTRTFDGKIALYNPDGSPIDLSGDSSTFVDREIVVFTPSMTYYSLSSDDEDKRIMLVGDYLSVLVPLDADDEMSQYCTIPVFNFTNHSVSCYNEDDDLAWNDLAPGVSPSIPSGAVGVLTKIDTNHWSLTIQEAYSPDGVLPIDATREDGVNSKIHISLDGIITGTYDDYYTQTLGGDRIKFENSDSQQTTDIGAGFIYFEDSNGSVQLTKDENNKLNIDGYPLYDNPYELLRPNQPIDWSAEFDTSVGLTYVDKTTGAGNVNINIGNHKLELEIDGVGGTNVGAFSIAITDIGASLAADDCIEAQMEVVGLGEACGIGVILSETPSSNTSKHFGILLYDWYNDYTKLYVNSGTFASPYTNQAIYAKPSALMKYRLKMVDSDTVQPQCSLAGNVWVDMGSPVNLTFTPTHIGFIAVGNGIASADYIRRYNIS